jgi:hypothetical protein
MHVRDEQRSCAQGYEIAVIRCVPHAPLKAGVTLHACDIGCRRLRI